MLELLCTPTSAPAGSSHEINIAFVLSSDAGGGVVGHCVRELDVIGPTDNPELVSPTTVYGVPVVVSTMSPVVNVNPTADNCSFVCSPIKPVTLSSHFCNA